MFQLLVQCWNKLMTATFSSLSFITNMLSHLALLSQLLGNRWKEAPVFWLGLLSQLVTYVQGYCIVLDCTSTDFHYSHTVINVQVFCLSLWSLKLCNRYCCSHVRFKLPTYQSCHSLQYFMYMQKSSQT